MAERQIHEREIVVPPASSGERGFTYVEVEGIENPGDFAKLAEDFAERWQESLEDMLWDFRMPEGDDIVAPLALDTHHARRAEEKAPTELRDLFATAALWLTAQHPGAPSLPSPDAGASPKKRGPGLGSLLRRIALERQVRRLTQRAANDRSARRELVTVLLELGRARADGADSGAIMQPLLDFVEEGSPEILLWLATELGFRLRRDDGASPFVILAITQCVMRALMHADHYRPQEQQRLFRLFLDACDRALESCRVLREEGTAACIRFHRAAVHLCNARNGMVLGGDTERAIERDLIEVRTILARYATPNDASHLMLVRALRNYGVLQIWRGATTDARTVIEEALQLARTRTAGNHLFSLEVASLAALRAGLGAARATATERGPVADDPGDEAITIAETLSASHRDLADDGSTRAIIGVFFVLAHLPLYREMIDHRSPPGSIACSLTLNAQALALHSAVASTERVFHRQERAQLLAQRAWLLDRTGADRDAHDAAAEACDLFERFTVALADAGWQSQAAGLADLAYEVLIRSCLVLGLDGMSGTNACAAYQAEAWQAVQRARARVTAHFIERAVERQPVEDQGPIAAEWRQGMTALAQRRAALVDELGRAGDLARRDTLAAEVAHLSGQMRDGDPALSPLDLIAPPILAEIQVLLRDFGAGTRLIELYPLRDRLAVFILDGVALSVRSVDTPAADLARATQRFREPIDRGGLATASFGEALDGALRMLGDCLRPVFDEHLTAPASPLDDEVPHLVLVPGGLLHFWPLWALPIPDSEERLLDRYACVVVPAAETLTWLREYQSSTARPVYRGFAPPLDEERVFALPIAHSGRLICEGDVYTGAAASFDRLCESNGAIIVVASHAKVQAEHPDLAHLQMAGADGRTDRVTALEILLELRRLHSPLIVLLACEVHGTGATYGENWAGLTRAFLRCTQTLVTSLWSIDQAWSLALAIPFWEALDRGLTVAQALRVAIREIRQVDRRRLREWGRRMATILPEEERTLFVAEWTTRFFQVPIATPAIDRWAPYMTIGHPGRIYPNSPGL